MNEVVEGGFVGVSAHRFNDQIARCDCPKTKQIIERVFRIPIICTYGSPCPTRQILYEHEA